MDSRPYADIYVEELEHLVRGYPVYCPDRSIHIGDVGFFRKDDNDHPFERLFNVLCDATDPGNQEYGVPDGFVTYQEYLARKQKTGQREGRIYDIIPDYYQPKEFMSASGITRDLKMKASTPEELPAGAHADVTYTLSKDTSAILSLLSTGTRAEIIDKALWREYIATYIDSWYTFARDHGFEEDQAPAHSIVLIKGCDKAQLWEHATFRGGKKGASITFGASASKSFVAELSGSWTSTFSLSPFQRKTPSNPRAQPPNFDLDPPTHTQTVFVRFYKIEYRKSLSTLFRGTRSVRVSNNNGSSSHTLPKGSSSANAPSGASSGSTPQSHTNVSSPPQSSQVLMEGVMDIRPEIDINLHPTPAIVAGKSVLDEVLEYLIEAPQKEDSDVAIVTHDDLLAVYGDVPLSPLLVRNLLRNSNISTYQSHNGWMGLIEPAKEDLPSVGIITEGNTGSELITLASGMDTPLNAAPQRWWDRREVEKRTWTETKHKRSVPEEQQAAFVHTPQLIASFARSTSQATPPSNVHRPLSHGTPPPDYVSANTLSFSALKNAIKSPGSPRQPSPGRLEKLILRDPGLDTPLNAAPQRWWDRREVGKRPWTETKRKRSVPEEQQAAFVHTRQRVVAAVRAVLGIAADITLLSGETIDLAPLQGLAPAAKTLLNIWDAMQSMDMNRMACLRITERCADILYGVREEIRDAGDNIVKDGRDNIDAELHDPIMKLQNAFAEVYVFLQKQVHQPFLNRYLKKDEILREIARRDQSLTDALSLFNLSIQIRILGQIQANEARRQADAAALVQAILGQSQGRSSQLLEPLDIFNEQSSTPRAARSTDTLHLDTGPAIGAARGTSPRKPLPAFLADNPETPIDSESKDVHRQTTLSAIHSTFQCLGLISALQGRQNDYDHSHDAADLAGTMKEALSAGNDAEILSVLQIGRDEIPEAIKTLQRALEREIDREAWETEVRVTPVLQSAAVQVQSEGWAGSVRSLASVESLWADTPHTAGESWPSSSTTGSVGEKIARKDTLDREFMEGGIEALRRLSKGPVSLPSWTITRYEVDRESKIGMGFFSDVYRGTWHGRTVAIKVLTESTPRALFKKEIEVWKSLRHRNVLLLQGASSATGNPPWFFVSPYYRNGTLAEYLRKLASMEGVDVMRMLHEIARGMEYLHSKGIMHGDLKASNVLVSDTVRCVLCDFGQSEMKSEARRLSGTPMPHGILRWQAPEVMMGQSHLTWQIDSYAFGICCIEILLKGAVPWPLNDDEAVRHFVLDDNVRPPLPASKFRTQELDALIWSCLSRNPDARPTFAGLDTNFERMRGKFTPGELEEPTSPDELPWAPPHHPSPSIFPVSLPEVDPSHSPNDLRPPGTYDGLPTVPTIPELSVQKTPPQSIFFEHPSDSSSEVDVDMEASGMLSPNPENHFAMLARNERRYRMMLQHEFHPSLTLPLWTPGTVNIGDVGYLEKPDGVFRTLFNAFDPEKTSRGLMQNIRGLRSFGDLKTESTRSDRRTTAQKGYDAFQQLNPFRKSGTPVTGRQYTYQLRNGHKAAYLVTEITEHHYMTALDVPKKWFVANVDKVIAVYGEKHNLEKEDIFLIVGKLDAPDHAQFVSHTHPDSQMCFNVFTAPRVGYAWGEFIHQSAESNNLGPHYRESPARPFVDTHKISNVRRSGQMDSVILARLRFKPDAVEPTSQ